MMNVTVPPLDPELLKHFGETYKVSNFVSQFFLRRGITKPEDLAFSLENDLRYTHNPFLFSAMEDVVERINQAILEEEPILVFGDRDVDGMTSISILVSYLKERSANVQWKLPMEDESYGLTKDGVTAFHEEGGTLIITVDCGISSMDSISLARDLGIDTIIIDHHNPPEELPPAVAIIDPKLPDCGYPFEGLSAAALSAKVVWALRFSQTELYGQEFCLLHARPGNESLYLDALVVKNLLVVRRVSEVVTGANRGIATQRVVPFIQGLPIFVYQLEEQKKLFAKVFGSAEVYASDLAPALWKQYPSMAGKSLLRLLAQSKTNRYRSSKPEEIDILYQSVLLHFSSQTKELEQKFKESLALVALSLVADMMPMINENRILMRIGLESLANIPNTWYGLQSILVELDLARKQVLLRDLGWKIAPLLNSSGRMGRPDVAIKLLLADDPGKCLSLVKELSTMNNERKRLGELAYKALQNPVKISREQHLGKFALVYSEEIPRGITGILAGRFSRDFGTSVAVLAKVGGNWVGSIRTSQNLKATWLLEQCSDLLGDYGGHDAAAGFFMEAQHLPIFSERIQKIIQGWTPTVDDQSSQIVDIVVHASELDDSLWAIPGQIAPHGQGFPAPVILLKNAQVISAQLMGKESRHLTLVLSTGKRQWQAVMWDGAPMYPKSFSTNDTINALISFEANNWRSTTVPQIILQDVERSTRP